MSWKEIPLEPKWKKACSKFADQVNPTTNYADSGQYRSKTTWKNHYYGKLAEFAVSAAYSTTPPDLKVYSSSKKTWKEDLLGQEKYAVKSQTLASFKKYDSSMTFQFGDRRKDKILNDPEAPVIYCLLLEDKALVSPVLRIKELTFGPPKLKKLAGEKTVAYLEISHPELITQAKEIIKEDLMVDIKVPKLNKLADLCYTEAANKGFHTAGKITDPLSKEMISFVANLHGEVSELYEAWREGRLHEPCDKAGKMEKAGLEPLTCLEEELADIFIRTLDTSHTFGVDMERAVKLKLEYNRTREFRHGNKLA